MKLVYPKQQKEYEILTGVSNGKRVHARASTRSDLALCGAVLQDMSNAVFDMDHKSNCPGCVESIKALLENGVVRT